MDMVFMTYLYISFLLALRFPFPSESREDLIICPNNGSLTCPGVSLQQALENVSSDTHMSLWPGTHFIRQFTLIEGVANISLIGDSSKPELSTTISCLPGIGLAFLNVQDLHLESIAITECGLTGTARATDIYQALNQTVDIFFKIPHQSGIGLFLGSCSDVVLDHVTIANTSGLGLLGINVMGESIFNEVDFINNTASTEPLCKMTRAESFDQDEVQRESGGGAVFLYHNYRKPDDFLMFATLMIRNSIFNGNSDCSPTGFVELYGYFTDGEHSYYVGGGGGLTLMVAQNSYSIDIGVDSSSFQYNTARFGSGAHIGVFSESTNTHIAFSNCTFHRNGLPTSVYSPEQLSQGGSGLAVLNDLYSPQLQYLQPSLPTNSIKNVSVEVLQSNFTGNSAYLGGGLFIYSHHSTALRFPDFLRVYCNQCLFESNMAALGPAIYARELRSGSFTPGIVIQFSSVTVKNNTVTPLEGSQFRSVGDSSAAVDFRNIQVTINGESVFMHNYGTGILGTQSSFLIFGNTTIANNIGEFGGGMRLVQYSLLFLQPNSTLTFRNNVGRVSGGALYVHFRAEPTYPHIDCFLYFGRINFLPCQNGTSCNELENLDVRVEFVGNVAPVGSTVYGSFLETCAWTDVLRQQKNYQENNTVLENLQELLPHVFYFDSSPSGVDMVTTLPIDLQVNQDPASVLTTIPGQSFNISVAAIDRLFQRAPTVITSTVLSTTNENETASRNLTASSLLGVSGYYFVRKDTTTTIPLTIFGPENQTVTVALYSVDSFADTQFTVHVQHCAPGFVYIENSSTCACVSELTRAGIECSAATQKLVIPNHLWIGSVDGEMHGDVEVVEECVFDYCRSGRKSITAGDYDAQCAEDYHRTGLLCGSCAEGYSQVFGSNRCLQCSNVYLLLLLFFVVAGIVLVLGLSLLRITVSEGYLYGVLFYCNIISLYTVVFIPINTLRNIFIVVAFLNLNLGVEVCFYDGMDSLARAGLQLLFPAYLFILMGIITLLSRSRYFSCFARAEFNAVHMFGTLLILCYTSILESCIEILGVIHTQTLSGGTLTRWVVDPSILYFHGWHGLLAFSALILVLFYVTLFPLVLLCPRYAYRWPLLKKLKPLYDILYHPFKPQFRFWLGLRLILRSVPLILAYFSRFPLNTFILAIYLIVFLNLELIIKPFKEGAVNATDSFFISNMIVLIIGALYFDSSVSSPEGDQSSIPLKHTIFSYIILFLAYAGFAGVFLYHIFLRLPRRWHNSITSWWQSAVNSLQKKLGCQNEEYEDTDYDILSAADRTSYSLRDSLL